MTDIILFKAFCIERYKFHHNMSGKDTFYLFTQYDVFDYINSFYDTLHSLGDMAIVEDIEEFIKVRGHQF